MEITPELLAKYGAGKCTPEEIHQVQAWLEAGSPDRTYFLMDGTDEQEEENWLMDKLQQHIHMDDSPVSIHPAKGKVRWPFIAVAASLLFLVCSFFIAKNSGYLSLGQKMTYHTVSVPYGKKASFVLPDGSHVYLNSGSSLSYPTVFDKKVRRVSLNGEGFFDVAQRTGQPFIVEVGETETEVLGTRFNLNNYRNKEILLSVEQGKVRFLKKNEGRGIVVRAGQSAGYRQGKLALDERLVSAECLWKEGTLVFRHATVSEMIPVLERWFDVSITVESPALYSLRMKGTYRHPSLQALLDDLSFAMHFHYKRNGRNILLYP